MDKVVKKIVKNIESQKTNCWFEVLTLDNKLIIFANKGSIEDIKEPLNKELLNYNHTIEIVNIATAYIIPRTN